MRTKTLLLTAALVAAGAATSMAQSNVYSLNVVGYINLPLVNGYNLVANQLNGTNNNINTVFPTATDQDVVFKWNAATQGFAPSDTYQALGNGWYDGAFNPSTTTLNPGEAFFYQSVGAKTVTLTGEVSQGTNTLAIKGGGYSFLSSPPPVVSGLSTNGFPQVDQMTYFTFSGGSYTPSYTYQALGNGWYDGAFNPVDPAPAVGQGFIVNNPGAQTSWTRSFVVQ
jgi:hypothetical protein